MENSTWLNLCELDSIPVLYLYAVMVTGIAMTL